MILRTPTDIFPNIDIPVISVAWQYTGLNPEELEGRLTAPYERSLTALVDNIEHIESTTYNGEVVVKVFLQPNANLANSNAQVTAASQRVAAASARRTASADHQLQRLQRADSAVGLSGKGIGEEPLNDLALNFMRTQIVTVPGAVVPYPYGGKQRQMMVNLIQPAAGQGRLPPTC